MPSHSKAVHILHVWCWIPRRSKWTCLIFVATSRPELRPTAHKWLGTSVVFSLFYPPICSTTQCACVCYLSHHFVFLLNQACYPEAWCTLTFYVLLTRFWSPLMPLDRFHATRLYSWTPWCFILKVSLNLSFLYLSYVDARNCIFSPFVRVNLSLKVFHHCWWNWLFSALAVVNIFVRPIDPVLQTPCPSRRPP